MNGLREGILIVGMMNWGGGTIVSVLDILLFSLTLGAGEAVEEGGGDPKDSSSSPEITA